MENSQVRQPNEVAGFGNMNINYSWPNELTQDIEIPVPQAVRVLRTVPVGPCYRKGVDTADGYQHDEV